MYTHNKIYVRLNFDDILTISEQLYNSELL